MNDIYNEIKELVKTKPKHFAQIIRRSADYMNAINAAPTDNISEKTYQYLNPSEAIICKNNQRRKFKSMSAGYGYCNITKHCVCAKEQISSKVSATKQTFSESKKSRIQKKREETNQKKYGVTNAGQTSVAKDNHAKFYSDISKVQEVVNQIGTTKEQKYGNKYYNNSAKIKATWKSKRDDYFINKFPDKKLTDLYDVDTLDSMYKIMSPYDIAVELNVHVQTVYKHLLRQGIRKPYTSSLEQEMVTYLESLGVTNIVRNSRGIISKEIDIYLPEYNIAIEMCGVYWHHDLIPYIDRNYHYQKFKECENQGIQLLTIFSDVWDSKKDIIKNMVASKLNKLGGSTIYARCTTVSKVSTSAAKEFLTKNHVQGYTPSKYRYGLYFKDQLVALMTFSTPRAGIGKYRANTAELVRYATCCSVPGGAGKLLAHFRKNHLEYSTVLSYSDNQWSNGNMYNKLGFALEKEHPAGYFYFCPRTRQRRHRYNYAKHILVKQGFDPNKSEYDIQIDRGFLRVWDCGKRTWILN